MATRSLKRARSAPVRKTRRPQARKPTLLRPTPPPPVQNDPLDLKARAFRQAERSWQQLSAPPGGDDRWGDVEEHLLGVARQREHTLRRWKYFAK